MPKAPCRICSVETEGAFCPHCLTAMNSKGDDAALAFAAALCDIRDALESVSRVGVHRFHMAGVVEEIIKKAAAPLRDILNDSAATTGRFVCVACSKTNVFEHGHPCENCTAGTCHACLDKNTKCVRCGACSWCGSELPEAHDFDLHPKPAPTAPDCQICLTSHPDKPACNVDDVVRAVEAVGEGLSTADCPLCLMAHPGRTCDPRDVARRFAGGPPMLMCDACQGFEPDLSREGQPHTPSPRVPNLLTCTGTYRRLPVIS